MDLQRLAAEPQDQGAVAGDDLQVLEPEARPEGGQVDGVPVRIEVRDRVPRPVLRKHEDVGSAAAAQQILAGAVVQPVGPSAAAQIVVAVGAAQIIVAGAPAQVVVAGPAPQEVVAGPAARSLVPAGEGVPGPALHGRAGNRPHIAAEAGPAARRRAARGADRHAALPDVDAQQQPARDVAVRIGQLRLQQDRDLGDRGHLRVEADHGGRLEGPLDPLERDLAPRPLHAQHLGAQRVRGGLLGQSVEDHPLVIRRFGSAAGERHAERERAVPGQGLDRALAGQDEVRIEGRALDRDLDAVGGPGADGVEPALPHVPRRLACDHDHVARRVD